jgi:hypothetical protein
MHVWYLAQIIDHMLTSNVLSPILSLLFFIFTFHTWKLNIFQVFSMDVYTLEWQSMDESKGKVNMHNCPRK